MKIVQITPGAGKMFCGGCLRDNALVSGLRKLGHDTVLVPLYLPLTLDEPDETHGTPIFFSGINVYLEQKSAFFRRAPYWLHRILASPSLLRLAAGSAAKTRPEDVGELTLSMLRGEEGRQSREIDELIAWFRDHEKPDIISLSNALLIGMAREVKRQLNLPIVCSLQGEDWFVDSLPGTLRDDAWALLAERAADVDLFIAPSQYYADLMGRRLRLPESKLCIVHNGVHVENYRTAPAEIDPPVLGFFARMCREKGLDQLVEAYIILRRRGKIPGLRLKVGGSCGPSDQPIVDLLKQKLSRENLLTAVEFCPNLTLEQKHDFYASLSVFSTPAPYGEAFGLYLIEAMAAGVPVVQPDHGAFPEVIKATGGGTICPAGKPEDLADAIEALWLRPDHGRALGLAGRAAVEREFNVGSMARSMVAVFTDLLNKGPTRREEKTAGRKSPVRDPRQRR